jgi:PBSX family phage terminase large subunit
MRKVRQSSVSSPTKLFSSFAIFAILFSVKKYHLQSREYRQLILSVLFLFCRKSFIICHAKNIGGEAVEKCYSCHIGIFQETDQESYVQCSECGAIKLTYQPQAYQSAYHADPHKFKAFFGGYGSGKTKTSVMEVIRHVLTTPGGTTLMGAATIPQLEQTSMKEFFDVFPRPLIKQYHKQKNYVDVINGHRILFRPLFDEGNIRSLNLTMFHIEEASEVDYSIFVQLQTRLRSHATKHHKGIISSNPDINWIRSEFLLRSEKIVGATQNYHIDPQEISSKFSSHIAATNLNRFLPPDFFETTSMGKPLWWVKRYLEGSFDYSEGMVYPDFASNVVEAFDIWKEIKSKGWEVFAGADFGLRDPTVFLLATVDKETGTVYIFDEHYEPNKPVSHHARIFNDMVEPVPNGLLRQPVGDPSGNHRSKNDLRSLFSHYAEYNIHFKPGQNRIEDGIQKVFTYFAHDKLKIFNTCTNTIREGIGYKYKLQELDNNKNMDEKPVDKDNHAMDTIRYIIQELPDDPEQLINKSFNPGELKIEKKVTTLPHALQEEEDDYVADWYNSYY